MQNEWRVYEMIVYHGSYKDIGDDIKLSESKVSRDFGSGFYVTNIFKQAEMWARQKGRENKTDGCVTKWEFNESVFNDKDFNTLKFDDYSVEWVKFITLNRKNNTNIPAHEYDIVEGPIADDVIYRSIDKYDKKKIPIEELVEVLKTREKSHQICFCTEYSLEKIHREMNFDAKDKIWEIGTYITYNLTKKDGYRFSYRNDENIPVEDEIEVNEKDFKIFINSDMDGFDISDNNAAQILSYSFE